MTDSEFRRAVEQARSEAEAVSPTDDSDRALLDHLKSDLDAVLVSAQQGTDIESQQEPLIQRMNEAILRFDLDHPGLAAALRTVVTSLSHSGV
jgi:hypothetical protein